MFKKISAFLFCGLFSVGAWGALPVSTFQNLYASGVPLTVGNDPSGVTGLNVNSHLLNNMTMSPAQAPSDTTNGLASFSAPFNATTIQALATAAGSTTIGTPAPNTFCRMLHVEIPGNAIQATAGVDTLTVALNGVTIAVLTPYVPDVSLGTGVLYQTTINFNSIAFNTGSAGTLTISLATALTGGAVNVNAYFN
jgi:hypothetical protein